LFRGQLITQNGGGENRAATASLADFRSWRLARAGVSARMARSQTHAKLSPAEAWARSDAAAGSEYALSALTFRPNDAVARADLAGSRFENE
jgi:hypothetical protein